MEMLPWQPKPLPASVHIGTRGTGIVSILYVRTPGRSQNPESEWLYIYECHLANLVVIAYCDWAAGMETGATQGATRNTANRTLPGKGG